MAASSFSLGGAPFTCGGGCLGELEGLLRVSNGCGANAGEVGEVVAFGRGVPITTVKVRRKQRSSLVGDIG